MSTIKEKLSEMGLSTSGKKAELVKRFVEAGGSIEDLQSMPGASGDPEEEEGGGLEENTARSTEQAAAEMPTALTREINLLHRQRDLAKRELELIRREVELLRTEQRPDSVVSTGRQGGSKLKNVKDLIGDFEGDSRNYEVWEKQIRRLTQSYELDDLETKALVCNKLKGKALSWYYSRTDCVEMTADDLLRELRQMFNLRLSKLQLRREFEGRKWKASETFADYIHHKVTLGNLVPIHESELVDYLIEGIPDTNLQAQANIQRFDNVSELLKAFSKVTLKNSTMANKISRQTEAEVPIQKKLIETGKQKDTGKSRCYNCNETGHFAASCKQPKRDKGSSIVAAHKDIVSNNARAPEKT